MSKQVAAIQSGMSPKAAYEEQEKQAKPQQSRCLSAKCAIFTSLERNRATQAEPSSRGKGGRKDEAVIEVNKQLEALSLTDSLTQLPNRRSAIKTLKKLWKDEDAKDLPSFVWIDADYFKQVNDTCGHEAGDLVLTELAQALKHYFRSDDIVCRLGGDEFRNLVRYRIKGGLHVAEAVRKQVSHMLVLLARTLAREHQWVSQASRQYGNLHGFNSSCR